MNRVGVSHESTCMPTWRQFGWPQYPQTSSRRLHAPELSRALPDVACHLLLAGTKNLLCRFGGREVEVRAFQRSTYLRATGLTKRKNVLPPSSKCCRTKPSNSGRNPRLSQTKPKADDRCVRERAPCRKRRLPVPQAAVAWAKRKSSRHACLLVSGVSVCGILVVLARDRRRDHARKGVLF